MEARIHVNTIAVAIDQRNCQSVLEPTLDTNFAVCASGAKLIEALDLKPCLTRRSTSTRGPSGDFVQLVEEYLKQPKIDGDVFEAWKRFVCSHYYSRVAVLNGEFDKGFAFLSQSVQHWLSIYESPNNSWLIPATRVIAFNLIDTAILADRQCDHADPHLTAHKHCIEAKVELENAFASIYRSGKRWSGLAVSNALYKLYFKLDEIQLAVVFQTRVASQLMPHFDEFPLGDRIVWKYYNGLIALERLKFREAEQSFTYALNLSHPTFERNIQKLIFFLIPLRLLYNEIPKEGVLERYGLQRLTFLIQAIRLANVGLFRKFQHDQAEYLRRTRIWPLTQKLLNVVYRNVLLKCHRYHLNRASANQSHQMPLAIFAAGLRISGMEEITVTEAMHIARVLIQKEMISGYIAFQRRLLVLAKQTNPFPALRNVNLQAGEVFVEIE